MLEMTRINFGVDPRNLPQKALLAEHREITRIPNAIRSGRANLNIPVPSQFTLGPGHVRFFYNKIRHLRNRYQRIYNECVRRGYNVKWKGDSFKDIPSHLNNEANPTQTDIKIVIERLKERGHLLQRKIREEKN